MSFKPVVSHQCANIDCKGDGVIYPEDEQFWYDGKFWFCSQKCFDRAASYNDGLKTMAVKQKWQAVNQARQVLGL